MTTMKEKKVDYFKTVWECDKHKEPLQFVACSPKMEVGKTYNFLRCPKCGKFGLTVMNQRKVKAWTTTLLY